MNELQVWKYVLTIIYYYIKYVVCMYVLLYVELIGTDIKNTRKCKIIIFFVLLRICKIIE